MNFALRQAVKVFIVSICILIFSIGIFYKLNYDSVLNHQLEDSRFDVEKISNSIDQQLSEKIVSVYGISISPIITEALTESNKYYSKLTVQQREQEIETQNENWITIKDNNDPFILEYTDNKISKFLQNLQNNTKSDYGEIFLTNKHGALVASTDKLTTFAHQHKYWWQGAYNNGEGSIFLDDRGYDESVDGYVLGIVVPIKSYNKIIGVLKVNLNILGSIDTIIENAQILGHEKLVLIRSNGVIIYEKGIKPLSKMISTEIHKKLIQEEERSYYLKNKAGKWIVGAAEINLTSNIADIIFGGSSESIDHRKGNSGESWYILDSNPISNVMKSSNNIINSFVLIGILLSIFTAITSLFLGKRIAKPIKELVKQAEQITTGDFDSQISINRTDEIGLLATSLNKMTKHLKKTTTTIDKINVEISERKKVEDELRISEDRINNLIEQSPLSMQILDLKGSTIQVNRSWEKIWGINWKEFSKLNYNILEDKQAQELGIVEYLKKAYSGETVTIPAIEYDAKEMTKYGNKRCVRTNVYPLRNKKGIVINIVLVQEDITIHKQAEKELIEKTEELEKQFNKSDKQRIANLVILDDLTRTTKKLKSEIYERNQIQEILKERERTYRTLIENLPGFAYRCNNDKNWTMNFISSGCEDVTGYSPEDFINNRNITFNDIILKEYRQIVWDKWQIVLEENSIFEYEYPILTKNKQIRWVWERGCGIFSDDGELQFLEGFITDITARKIAQEEEKKQHQKIALLSETAMQFIELPSEENLYQFIAQKIEEHLGVEAYIIVNSINNKILTTRAITGIKKYSKKLITLLGRNPIDNVMTITGNELDYLLDGRIHYNEKDLYGIAWKTIPKKICKAVEKLADLGDIYTAGIVKGKQLLGTVNVLLKKSKKTGSIDLEFLETFIKQAAIAVQKYQAERALIESEQLSSAVIEGSPIGISIRDRFGTLILYNKVWKKIWGLTNEEIKAYKLKRTKFKMNRKDKYLGEHGAMIRKVYEEGGSYFVPELKTKPGKRFKAEWVMQRFYAIKGNDKKVERVVVLTTDISKRKKAENALLESETKYRSIVENMIDGYYRSDEEGNTILISPSASRIIGFSEKEIIGKKISSFYAQARDREKFINEIQKEGSVVNFTAEFKKKGSKNISIETNSRMYYDEEGNYNGIEGTFRDITNRKKMENSLRESEEKYRKLIETTAEGFWLIDSKQKTLDVNQSLCDMIGYPKEEIIGKTPFDFCDKEYHGIFKEQIIQSKTTKQRTYEIILRKKNGKSFPTLFNATSLFDSKGTLSGSFAFVTDITELKQAEEQIRKDLQEKTTLLQELYHRTKNNMQVISAMLSIRARRSEDSYIHSTFKEIIDKIKTMSLVHEKLYISKDLSNINLKEYIVDLIELLMGSYRIRTDRIGLNLDLEDMAILIDTAVPLGLILNELISNVFKHAFPDDVQGKISVKLYKDKDGTINIHLDDNGVGVSSGSDLRKGKSMGLQTVFTLIEYQLKGKISYKIKNGIKWHIKLKDDLHKKRV